MIFSLHLMASELCLRIKKIATMHVLLTNPKGEKQRYNASRQVDKIQLLIWGDESRQVSIVLGNIHFTLYDLAPFHIYNSHVIWKIIYNTLIVWIKMSKWQNLHFVTKSTKMLKVPLCESWKLLINHKGVMYIFWKL